MQTKSAALLGYENLKKYAYVVPPPKNSAIPPTPPAAGRISSPTPYASTPKAEEHTRQTRTQETATEKKAFDDNLAGILGAIGGGVGGYALGTKVLEPLLARKERSIEHMLAQGQDSLKNIRKAKAGAPLGAAAIGALVLATIAAKRARAKEQEKLIHEQLLRQQLRENPALGPYGITANEVLPFNRGFY